MKPSSSCGRPARAGPVRRGSADRAIRRDVPAALERKPRPGVLARTAERAQVDVLRREPRLEVVCGARAEHVKWTVLGRDDGERDPVAAVVAQVRAREQRELVQRQRPRRPRRDDEGDARDRPGLRLGQHARHHVPVLRTAERQRTGERRLRDGAERDEQRVVGELFPGAPCGRPGAPRRRTRACPRRARPTGRRRRSAARCGARGHGRTARARRWRGRRTPGRARAASDAGARRRARAMRGAPRARRPRRPR